MGDPASIVEVLLITGQALKHGIEAAGDAAHLELPGLAVRLGAAPTDIRQAWDLQRTFHLQQQIPAVLTMAPTSPSASNVESGGQLRCAGSSLRSQTGSRGETSSIHT